MTLLFVPDLSVRRADIAKAFTTYFSAEVRRILTQLSLFCYLVIPYSICIRYCMQ